MRDVENLILNTLVEVIAEGTSIPSGDIWLKRPAMEFVGKGEGPNSTDDEDQINFPCINIEYMGDATYQSNNYGESVYVDNGDGTTTSYTPMAEIKLNLAISLFTKSRKNQITYGAEIEHLLLELDDEGIAIRNDEIDGEYFGLKLLFKKDVNVKDPHQKVYIVECTTRILKETTADTVNQIIVNAATVETVTANYDDTVQIFNYASSGTTWN